MVTTDNTRLVIIEYYCSYSPCSSNKSFEQCNLLDFSVRKFKVEIKIPGRILPPQKIHEERVPCACPKIADWQVNVIITQIGFFKKNSILQNQEPWDTT